MEAEITSSHEDRLRGLDRLLAALPLFAGLDAGSLAAIADAVEWFSLPAGSTLFEQGDRPDGLYIVVSGCLGAYREDRDGTPVLLGRIAAAETVGEMAVISGKRRSASVRCLRDSELLRLSKTAFDQLLDFHPRAMLHFARLVVERLETAQRRRATNSQPRTFAIIPHGEDVPLADFSTALAAALGRYGASRLLTAAEAAERTSEWFHRVEAGHDYVVYAGDPTATPWTRLCLRQSDCLLLTARAAAAPRPWLTLPDRPGEAARSELVLLHGDGPAAATATWLAQHPVGQHHHIAEPGDMDRLARLLTGRAVGLVLSGGGARGFAHIGVIRALREAGVPLDLVGGTSMGAVVGAGVAAGWDDRTLSERLRSAFLARNPLTDFTVPMISLAAGRRVAQLLHDAFGERRIEDLKLPFYCLTADLARGRTAVHRDGPLWRWLRAAVAIPGVLPPVFAASGVHVDAGIINNLPVDVMRALGRGPVIGVDVTGDEAFAAGPEMEDLPPLWRRLWRRPGERRLPTILQILWRAATVNSDAAVATLRDQTDLLLQPPLESVDMLNWRGFDRAVEAGYRYAAERLAATPRPLPADGTTLVL